MYRLLNKFEFFNVAAPVLEVVKIEENSDVNIDYQELFNQASQDWTTDSLLEDDIKPEFDLNEIENINSPHMDTQQNKKTGVQFAQPKKPSIEVSKTCSSAIGRPRKNDLDDIEDEPQGPRPGTSLAPFIVPDFNVISGMDIDGDGICRLCFSRTLEENYILSEVKSAITRMVPSLEFLIDEEHCICDECLHYLNIAHQFVNTCLHAQHVIIYKLGGGKNVVAETCVDNILPEFQPEVKKKITQNLPLAPQKKITYLSVKKHPSRPTPKPKQTKKSGNKPGKKLENESLNSSREEFLENDSQENITPKPSKTNENKRIKKEETETSHFLQEELLENDFQENDNDFKVNDNDFQENDNDFQENDNDFEDRDYFEQNKNDLEKNKDDQGKKKPVLRPRRKVNLKGIKIPSETKFVRNMGKIGKIKILCPKCDVIFEAEDFLNYFHQIKCEIVIKSNSFVSLCDHCDHAVWGKRMAKHFSLKHKQFQCNGCKTVCKNEEDFKEHCEECLRGGRQQIECEPKDDLTPQEKVPNVRKFLCHLCGKNYNNSNGLKSHLLTHKTVPSPCEYCSKPILPACMKHHILSQHKTKRTAVCDICGKTMLSCSIKHHKLCKHTVRTKNFRCDVCGNLYISKSSLRSHYMQQHQRKYEKTCPRCFKTFRCTSNLRLHLKNCGKIQPSEILIQKYKLYGIKKNTEGRFTCGKCVKTFYNRRTALFHYEIKHKNNLEYRKYGCEICGLFYNEKSTLNRHMEAHAKDKGMFRCNVCNRRYKSEKELEVHARKHVKKYKCFVCFQGFGRVHLMETHVKMEHPDYIAESV